MGKLGQLSDSERCVAIKRDGTRCRQLHMTGVTVCQTHGGRLPGVKRKSQEAKIVTAMQKLTIPIDESDPEAHPIRAFEIEFRRTVARIRWFDDQLAQLETEQLTFGKTKEEHITASEWAGVNLTFEAGASALYDLQFRERQHLLAMEKVWISAKLDARKLDIERDKVVAFDTAITKILQQLGHDIHNADVRNIVRVNMLAIEEGHAE